MRWGNSRTSPTLPMSNDKAVTRGDQHGAVVESKIMNEPVQKTNDWSLDDIFAAAGPQGSAQDKSEVSSVATGESLDSEGYLRTGEKGTARYPKI